MKCFFTAAVKFERRKKVLIASKNWEKQQCIMHTEMKYKIQKEYYRRVRQLTSSKLNGGNTVRAINSRAASLVRYTAGILKWTKDELNLI